MVDIALAENAAPASLDSPSRQNRLSFIRALLSSEELRLHTCKKFFQRYDANGNGTLELDEVKVLVSELCSHLGVTSPDEEKVQQLFGRFNKSATQSMLQDEFPRFFKVLLRGLEAKCTETSDRKVKVSAVGLNGESIASACVTAGTTLHELTAELQRSAERPVPSTSILNIQRTTGELFIDSHSTLAELKFGDEETVLAIFSDAAYITCEACGQEHELLCGLPNLAILSEECSCGFHVENAELRVERVMRCRQEKAMDFSWSVQEQLDIAFEGVQLGRGATLHEAVGMDIFPFASDADVRALRRNDARHNWKLVREGAEAQAALGTCACGCRTGSTRFNRTQGTLYPFSFFDPESTRFHLPAYLAAAIEELRAGQSWRAEELMDYLLLAESDKRAMKLRLLSEQQCLAVSTCISLFYDLGATPHVLPELAVQIYSIWASGRAVNPS